jgi:hypothetical protein
MIWSGAEFTNLYFKNFNKEPLFSQIIRIFEENKYENYFFSKIPKEDFSERLDKYNLSIKPFITKFKKKYFSYPSKELEKTGLGEFKREYWGSNLSFLIKNIKVYYFISKSKFNDIENFTINNISNTEEFSTGYYPGFDREYSLSSFFLALKWFYNDNTKKYYSERLLKEMKEYEEYLEKYKDSEFLKNKSKLK